MASICHASGMELFYIALTIVAGAIFINLLILNIKKRTISTPASQTLHAHGLRLTDDFSEKSQGYQYLDEKVSATNTLPASLRHEPRGLLSHLPSREAQTHEPSWTIEEKKQSLHKVVISSHEENQRSTYLGQETYKSFNPTPELFGWHKPEGQPTVFLGEVATTQEANNEIYLRLTLHPEDATTVCTSGWGHRVEKSVWEKITTQSCTQRRGIEVLIHAARNDTEIEQIMKPVLNAAIWWVAGLSDEEDV